VTVKVVQLKLRNFLLAMDGVPAGGGSEREKVEFFRRERT
jgi:hypothetical protein